MGFSIKVAPGVRVRASSRGVRTSLGPRAARVHVGGGRTGVSTGIGPVSYYTSLGSSGRSTHRPAAVTRQLAAPTPAQAEKAAEAQRLEAAFAAISSLHRQTFPTAQRPVAPPPPEPPGDQLRRLYRAEARRGVSLFHRQARRAATAQADARSESQLRSMRAALQRQHAAQQLQLSELWRRLCANDPDTVMECLVAAFADNEAPAAPLDVTNDEASLVVFVPSPAVLPERKPTVTASGNLSLKKLTKTEAAQLYKQLILAHVLVTLREAFAVAPGLHSARIVAVRPGPAENSPSTPQALIVAMGLRSALSGASWERVDAVHAAEGSLAELRLREKGAARVLQPIPLDDESDLRRLIAALEFEGG